mmetsp:Transcript_4205/g.8484  ORF Transcript_4205/g.8484 Transcript_4205/m.8484 type:complete len:231 (-) Transcript_4205:328-1020(-)
MALLTLSDLASIFFLLSSAILAWWSMMALVLAACASRRRLLSISLSMASLALIFSIFKFSFALWISNSASFLASSRRCASSSSSLFFLSDSLILFLSTASALAFATLLACSFFLSASSRSAFTSFCCSSAIFDSVATIRFISFSCRLFIASKRFISSSSIEDFKPAAVLAAAGDPVDLEEDLEVFEGSNFTVAVITLVSDVTYFDALLCLGEPEESKGFSSKPPCFIELR